MGKIKRHFFYPVYPYILLFFPVYRAQHSMLRTTEQLLFKAYRAINAALQV